MTLSEEIRNCRAGVIDNPWQGPDKKVVFICSMGILRSATGARLYAHKYNTRCAGTWEEALIPLTDDLMLWADQLVFVNKQNYQQVMRKLHDNDKDMYNRIGGKCKVLDIPDTFPHMHSELVQAFLDQYEPV